MVTRDPLNRNTNIHTKHMTKYTQSIMIVDIVNPYTMIYIFFSLKSHDSSVSIALGYGLNDQGSRVRFPVGAGNFSLPHHVQNGSGAHPASCPMGTRGFFPGSKAAGA
jgi:hypothetical protein